MFISSGHIFNPGVALQPAFSRLPSVEAKPFLALAFICLFADVRPLLLQHRFTDLKNAFEVTGNSHQFALSGINAGRYYFISNLVLIWQKIKCKCQRFFWPDKRKNIHLLSVERRFEAEKLIRCRGLKVALG